MSKRTRKGFRDHPSTDYLTPENYIAILGARHDGIVPVTSALDNRDREEDVWGDKTELGPMHSSAMKVVFSGPTLLDPDSQFVKKVIKYLNNQVSSPEFSR